jgi:transcriptional regulator with XRE-family HTH domain
MQHTLSEYVAREVRAEMARQGVSQRELAERLGFAQSGLSKRLTGQLTFRAEEWERIAEILGVPVTQFLPVPAAASAA